MYTSFSNRNYILLTFLLFLFCNLNAQNYEKNNANVLADEYFEKANYSSAVEKYQEATSIYQASNKIVAYAYSSLRIAESNIRLGKINEGLELAQNILTFINENTIKDTELTAESYSVIGDAYLNLGRNEQALEFLLKALEQYNVSQHTDTSELAQCYNDLGIIYWNNGNNNLALQYHENALEIRKKIHQSINQEVADSYNNIGLVYSTDDQQLNAISNFENALNIYTDLLDDNHPKIAQCYNNLALAHDELGNYDEALDYLDKVLEVWNQTYQNEHPNKAFTHLSIGRVFYNREEYTPAIESLEKALKSYLALYGDKHPEIANTYNLLGGVYFAQGNFEQSIDNYNNAVYANLYDQKSTDVYSTPDLTAYYNADVLLVSLQKKSDAFEALHYNKTLKLRELKAALSHLEAADKLISRIRKIRLGEKDKLKLSEKATEVYQAGVELCYRISDVTINKKYYLEKAFDFAERSKSSTLLSAIQDTNAKQFSGIPNDLLEQEIKLKSDIAFYEQKLAESNGNSNEEQEIKSKLLSLNSDYNTFIKELENKYPKYYNLKFNEAHISLSELQSSLKPETAFITHFITKSEVYCFYITSSKLKIESVDKIEKYDNFVVGLRNSIKYDSKEHYLLSARQLYTQLFPFKILNSITELIIVPDGNLATIPFEVLLYTDFNEESNDYQDLPYLIKKYNISYDNSATLYTQRKKEIDAYQSETDDILLVAPVNFKDSNYGNLNARLSDLPGTKTEVNEIKYLFMSKDHDITALTQIGATEQNFRQQDLNRYKYVHFATHGMVDEAKPELSRIFLSPQENGNEDGSLYSGEIYNIDIHADLVCLSACQTGLGKLSKGEGIIGLSRALLYAGAENLIVSLWTVSDSSTSELMIDFYNNHLYSNHYNTFNGALRKAKLKLINDGKFSKPYYWAPFVLIGE